MARAGARGVAHRGRRAAALFSLLVAAACRQDMQDQPKYKDLRGSAFFDDHRSARPLPEGTVAQGFLNADRRLVTGKEDGELVAVLPVPLTRELLSRGQERYGIFCTPCHGLTGDGLGIVVQRGLRRPNSFHIDRLREAPVGYFFDVQTRGFGAMMDYATQIPTADRWAIAAYIRALQVSQHARIEEVPDAERRALASAAVPPSPAPLPVESNEWAGAPGTAPAPTPPGKAH